MLGLVYMDEIVFGMTKTPEKVFEQAEQAAQQSLAADPDYPPNVLWSQIYRVKKTQTMRFYMPRRPLNKGRTTLIIIFFWA